MYQLKDTIVAVSSPTSDFEVIVRITGPNTIGICREIFSPELPETKAGLFTGKLVVEPDLCIDAALYLFRRPHSYTAETLAELHTFANSSIARRLIEQLLARGIKMAQPGEFTARAYLNGKIDLAQAEAVNEIITSSNRLQLAAAERVLAGHLTETTEDVASELVEYLGLIEAGLDFSQEDIEFITPKQAVDGLNRIKAALNKLLSTSINYESIMDLPSVGIAGATNAGKSSLCNKLLGQNRSIVSPQQKTTRDVLTGFLDLAHCRCVLFDCAGLILEPQTILDRLAQQAAVEALQKSSIVIFCVDISKSDFQQDISILKLIDSQVLILTANKSDLLQQELVGKKLTELSGLFGADFLPISAETSANLESLLAEVDKKIIDRMSRSIDIQQPFFEQVKGNQEGITLTVRHRQTVTEAIENISQAVSQLKLGNEEIAAMMLRTAYQAISGLSCQSIDEQLLEGIFKRFCVGK
ncbi:MAG: tRNA modification GTPase [Planctomycetota bacterium]|jgi:tRNA modification GTPase